MTSILETTACGNPNAVPCATKIAGAHVPALAVVIPCYRVARHLAQVVENIGPEVSHIYCVIDACPEGSSAVATQAANKDPRVCVLHHQRNTGVGGAVFTGYRQALADGAEIIVKLDGDGQMAPDEIPYLVQPILRGEADYVKGNRFFNLEDLWVMPTARLFGNAGLSFFSKLSSGYWNLFDPTNGFTAIHAEVANVVPWAKVSRRYFFESDLLFRLYALRAVIVDVPLKARYGDERSNLSATKALFQFPLLHLRNLIKRIFYCYFLRDFNVASVNLVLAIALCGFGLVFGLRHWISGYGMNILASSGTVMLAALPTILGWQALLAFVAFDVGNIPRTPLHRFLRDLRERAGQLRGDK